MEPIKPPRTLRVYTLIKQSGLNFTYCTSGSSGMGMGFYLSQQEAEHQRTLEVLKDTTTGIKPHWHLFEIEVPNPACPE